MERIHLYVPPEEYAQVKASGAFWDDESKRWYIGRDMVSMPSTDTCRLCAKKTSFVRAMNSNSIRVKLGSVTTSLHTPAVRCPATQTSSTW